jgi:hypothetical protein
VTSFDNKPREDRMIASPAEWFGSHLASTTDSFVWSARQVPEERLYAPPPRLLGEWSAARHAFHLLHYEREVALPALKLWVGEPYPSFENFDEDAAWGDGREIEGVLAEFRAVRSEQLALLAQLDSDLWQEPRDTPWGDRTLYWVTSKTYQHGIEHQNQILRIALIWEHYEKRSAERPDAPV